MASPAAIKATTIGKRAKTELPGGVFSEPFNESLVHEAARADLNARRQGTHSSLTRGEVAMTGAKAWRQKGTGRARVGALSVPHRRGGGNAFATKPRSYTVKMNRKARRKALRAALSVHAERESLAVLPAGSLAEPRTREAAELLDAWGGSLPVLVVIAGAGEETIAKSFRNLPRVSVVSATAVGVAELVAHRSLIVTEPALEMLAERARPVVRAGADDAAAPQAGGEAAKGAAPAAAKKEPEAKADEPEPEATADDAAEAGGDDEGAAAGDDVADGKDEG